MRGPASILKSIPGFENAVVLEQVSNGPTNDSYVLEHGGERYVLRLDKPEAARLGLDRAAELSVCEAVAAAGMGLPPVHFDAAAGICLRHFLPGRTWRQQDVENPDKLARLAALLRELHALPAAGAAFKPLKAAGRYARQIGTREAGELFGQAATAYALIEPSAPALCHNDLVCGNIIEGESLSLIDWEYAGSGDPFFDLAIVVQHHGLDEERAEHFLAAYLERGPKAADRKKLRKQRRFYAALLNLWEMRVTQ